MPVLDNLQLKTDHLHKTAESMWLSGPSIGEQGRGLRVIPLPCNQPVHVWWDLTRSKHVTLLWSSLTPVVKSCENLFAKAKNDFLSYIYI